VALTAADLDEIERTVSNIEIHGDRLPAAVLKFSNR
jgi:hypothetical protein